MEKEMIETAIAVDMMKELGYSCFVGFFYGGGDSGGFEGYHMIPRDFVCVETGDLLVDRYSDEFTKATTDVPDVPDIISDGIPSSYYHEHDWWNNEGGSGYIVVDLENLRYYTYYNINDEDQSEHPLDEDGEKLPLLDDGEPDWDNHCPVYGESTESSMGDYIL